MENELQPTTEAGRRMVALAEEHARAFALDAAHYDRINEFPHAHLAALQESGFMYAPLPVAAGGMGVESVHDAMLATSRLARGDASITLGVNMHFMVLLTLGRQRRMFLNRGEEHKARAVEAQLATIAAQRWVIAAAVSEPEQDLTRPHTTARLEDGHWVVNGFKVFSSMSVAATHFTASVSYVDDEGNERNAYVMVPRNAPGVTVHDDWDAMGMRASGSASVTFDNVAIDGRGPGRGARAGVLSAEFLELFMNSGPAHTAAALGVAEAGHQLSIEGACKKRLKNPEAVIRPFVQERAAENSIDLAAARAVFGRALGMIDEYEGGHPTERGRMAEVTPVFVEAQRAKAFVTAAATRILDRALAMSGGGGYLTANPLSRLYRDARAGAFMHPLGTHLATEYLGAHTLGLRPTQF